MNRKLLTVVILSSFLLMACGHDRDRKEFVVGFYGKDDVNVEKMENISIQKEDLFHTIEVNGVVCVTNYTVIDCNFEKYIGNQK